MKRTFRLGDSRPDAPREVHDEIEFHLAMRTREFVEQGLAPEAARKAALSSFGNVPAIEAELRATRKQRDRQRRWHDWVVGTWHDIRLSARALRRAPAFTLTTAVTLGLGVGALSAIFTVVNAVLLRMRSD